MLPVVRFTPLIEGLAEVTKAPIQIVPFSAYPLSLSPSGFGVIPHIPRSGLIHPIIHICIESGGEGGGKDEDMVASKRFAPNGTNQQKPKSYKHVTGLPGKASGKLPDLPEPV